MKVLFFFKNSESLGIEYLSAILKDADHQTDLLFDIDGEEFNFKFLRKFSALKNSVIYEKIDFFKPDLIIFSIFTHIFPWVESISKLIKERYDIPIFVGGPHVIQAPEYVIKNEFIDFICLGEGETVILPFMDALAGKTDFSEVNGIWYKKNNKIIKTKPANLITDLDSIPFPDKDLFYRYGAFNKRYFITTQRGCPFHCTYCIEDQMYKLYEGQKYLRRRSVENVINELKWAKERYKIKSVHFSDDDFLVNKKWIKEFVRQFEKSGIDLKFKILAHPNSVTSEKVKLLKRIGCILIAIGIESGSSRIRKEILNRNTSEEKIKKAARIIHSYGIQLDSLNMINIPEEKPADMIKTLVLNRSIKPQGFHIVNLFPFPNTKITQFCFQKGSLTLEQKEKILRGTAGFRDTSIIKSNYRKIGDHIRKYGFLYIKLPYRFRKIFLYLPDNRILKNLHNFFLSSPKNLINKIQDVLYLALKTNSYYSHKMYLQKL